MWEKIKLWWIQLGLEDPDIHCEFHKEYGCAHAGGFLCDYPRCAMLDEWQNDGCD
jgi:hypothetical protein